MFVPRQKRAALEANGDKSKGSDAADAPEREAKLARTESNDKRSVFERLKSGSGKVCSFSHWLQCLMAGRASLPHDIQKKLFSFQRQNVKVEDLKFLFLCNFSLKKFSITSLWCSGGHRPGGRCAGPEGAAIKGGSLARSPHHRIHPPLH